MSGLFVPEVERLYGQISSVPLKDEVSCLAPLKHGQNPDYVTRDTPRDLGLSWDREILSISTEINLLPVISERIEHPLLWCILDKPFSPLDLADTLLESNGGYIAAGHERIAKRTS